MIYKFERGETVRVKKTCRTGEIIQKKFFLRVDGKIFLKGYRVLEGKNHVTLWGEKELQKLVPYTLEKLIGDVIEEPIR